MSFSIHNHVVVAGQLERVVTKVADKEVVSRLNAAIPSLLNSFPGTESSKAIGFIADALCHLSEGDALSCISNIKWSEVFKHKNALTLLALVAGCAKAVAEKNANWHRDVGALSVTHPLVTIFIGELLEGQRRIQPQAIDEAVSWLNTLPETLEEIQKQLPKRNSPRDEHEGTEVVSLSVAMLRLMVSNNLPGAVANRILASVLAIENLVDCSLTVNRFSLLASNSRAEALADDKRIQVLGRAAFYGAHKHRKPYLAPERSTLFEKIKIPSSRNYWEYLGRRFEAISHIPDPTRRHAAVYRYTNFIIECLAAEDFFRKEEQIFRKVNLDGGQLTSGERRFYVDHYMVDNPPGIRSSSLNSEIYAETAERFKQIAATRYEINVRKGYATTIDSGYWLLEEMATDLGSEFYPLRAKNIEHYPGSGTVLSKLEVARAIDLSSQESRTWYFERCPWLRNGVAALATADLYFTRGWTAIGRRFELLGSPIGAEWKGLVDGEPYVAVWFNDHYYNNRLPEVRHWHIPERVFQHKLGPAIENGIDPSTLDLTPEGFIEAAASFNLHILNVGTASTRFGSFANAWPFGTGLTHSWESKHSLEFDKWTDPFHLHRGVIIPGVNHLTPEIELVFDHAREQHLKLRDSQKFFEDLHSSFLSIEEAWAKGYAGDDLVVPAKLEHIAPLDIVKSRESSSEGGDLSGASSDLGALEFNPRTRTRVLGAFLELRNKMVRKDPEVSAEKFPMLELQYTRLFSRQRGTPFITGADLCLHLPDGGKVFLAGSKDQVVRSEVQLSEGMEAWWVQEMVSRFALNNCPRIIFP